MKGNGLFSASKNAVLGNDASYKKAVEKACLTQKMGNFYEDLLGIATLDKGRYSIFYFVPFIIVTNRTYQPIR